MDVIRYHIDKLELMVDDGNVATAQVPRTALYPLNRTYITYVRRGGGITPPPSLLLPHWESFLKKDMHKGLPTSKGLYDSRYEHDACGVGLLVNIKGVKSHQLVEKGLQVLEHMVHRGAEGADPKTGDGAGIMVQIPHEFILLQGNRSAEKGRYGTGLVFLPKDEYIQQTILDIIEREAMEAGLSLIAVRDVPTNNDQLGIVARGAEPAIRQIFIADESSDEPMEPRLYILRRRIEKKIASLDIPDKEQFYIVSLSSRVIVYKGNAVESATALLFPRPDESAFHHRDGACTFALLHQHFSDMGTGTAVQNSSVTTVKSIPYRATACG